LTRSLVSLHLKFMLTTLPPSVRLARATYLLVVIGAACWCSAIILAPLLVASGGILPMIGQGLYQFFHPICHQLDGRTLHLMGKPLAVCSRCSSLYGAFFLGALLYPFLRGLHPPVLPHRLVLLAAAVPMLLDVTAGMIGLHAVTNETRVLSGVLLGIVMPFFLIPAAIDGVGHLFREYWSTKEISLQKGLSHAHPAQ
jgi:uncharacterized membrane protein